MKRLLSSTKTFKLLFGLLIVIAVALRFYKLGDIPIGYTFDEVAIAYDAWSISEWGADIFLHPYPKVFQSLGDYKAPLMIYLTSLIYSLSSFNLEVVRLISAMAGVLYVTVVYLVAIKLFDNKWIALLAMGLTCLSAWSIHLSRMGFEANLSILWILLGLWLFLKASEHGWLYLMSAVFFSLSVITYHSPKIVVPLLILVLIVTARVKFRRSWHYLIVGGLILIGTYYSFVVNVGFDTLERSKQTIIFYNELGQFSLGKEQVRLMFENIVKHLSMNWWMLGQQSTLRHLVPGYGILMKVELPLLMLGLIGLWRKSRKIFWMMSGWMVIAMIPSVIGDNSLHALRASLAMPAMLISVAYGLVYLVKYLRVKLNLNVMKLAIVLIISLYSWQYFNYLNTYYYTFPQASATDFQYGYMEAVQLADKHREKGDNLILTQQYGNPIFHALVALDYSPTDYQGGRFSYAKVEEVKWPNQESGVIYIATPDEIDVEDENVLDLVKIPNTEQVVFVIAKK